MEVVAAPKIRDSPGRKFGAGSRPQNCGRVGGGLFRSDPCRQHRGQASGAYPSPCTVGEQSGCYPSIGPGPAGRSFAEFRQGCEHNSPPFVVVQGVHTVAPFLSGVCQALAGRPLAATGGARGVRRVHVSITWSPVSQRPFGAYSLRTRLDCVLVPPKRGARKAYPKGGA